MFLFLLLALIWAKVKGYKLKPLLKAYSLYPFAVANVLYLYLQISIFLHNYSFVQYTGIINSVYMYTLIIPILYYRLYKPGLCASASVVFGTLLNKIAMWQNNGKMPVYASLSKITGYYTDSAIQSVDNIHIAGDETTRLKFLTDFIDVGYSILSIGDLFIHLFAFIIIYYTVKEINARQKCTNKILQKGM